MKNKISSQRKHTGFLTGLAAGLIASLVMLFLSVVINGLSLPEVFGSELTALMPPPLFEYLHQTIGGDAKHYLFYGIFVGQCLVFAVSSMAYVKILRLLEQRAGISARRPQPLHYVHGLLLALILWLFTGFILLPLTGGGIFGAALEMGWQSAAISLGIVGLVFGYTFILFYNWLVTRPVTDDDEEEDIFTRQEKSLTRRKMLEQGVILAGVGLLGFGAWRFITQGASSASVPVANLTQKFKSKIIPPPKPIYGDIQPVKSLSPEVTSNEQYYVVSKNLFSDPSVDAKNWTLTIDGQVEKPYTLTYDQLLALPMQKQYESMMCISNEVGGPYMSNALWEGVPLKYLLERAGVKTGSTKVVFYAVDDYSDSIHIEKALEQTTLLAVRMNGETLPQGHGFPARMLVPGIYGMKHCKWIKRIEVINGEYQGYWQQRGWSDPAPIRMTTRIDTPLIGSTVSKNKITYIAGVAFSGNKGIAQVDVSVDGGQTWERAILKKPLSQLTWVLWEYAWQPRQSGNYTVIARAIDMEGNVQNPEEAAPLPDGSSGYHTINLTVA